MKTTIWVPGNSTYTLYRVGKDFALDLEALVKFDIPYISIGEYAVASPEETKWINLGKVKDIYTNGKSAAVETDIGRFAIVFSAGSGGGGKILPNLVEALKNQEAEARA